MAVGNSMGIGIPMVNLGLGGGGGGGAGFLLDDYPNTIGHSYSLRKLSSTVTKVVRVRRNSDNTEQDFTATEITDGTLASFCGVGDGFVTKWYDQSNAIDVQNITALQQPKIVSGGSVILENGKPCMEFDGVDDSLNFPLAVPFPVQYYLFAVNTYVSASLGSDGYMYGLSAPFPSPFTGPNSFRWDGLQGKLQGSGADLSFTQPGTFSQSLYYARQVATTLPGTGSQIKINETQHPILGGTNIGTTNINTIALGEKGPGGENGNIKLQEFILYFADPIINETAIQSNINTHYSIY